MLKRSLIVLGVGLWIVFSSCEGKRFIKIHPENGSMKLMTESGSFGSYETLQTYFCVFIKERDSIKLDQGFVVIKVHRHSGDEGKLSYRLLDSVNKYSHSFDLDISPESNWSDEEKKEILQMRRDYAELYERFINTVDVYIERSALKTGVSQLSFLLPNTIQYEE